MTTKIDKKRILIADDDIEIRSIIGESISVLGYECLLASDGEEAQNICKKALPDLAILDFVMPKLTGPELCRWIKSQDGGEMVPILVLTARIDVKDKVETLGHGADDYLTKPFNYKELQARVNALLRVRDLNLKLHQKNIELQEIQTKLIEKERQLLANELAGTTAHALGQPVAAIMLNTHLIDVLPKDDSRFKTALAAVVSDAQRMAEILKNLQNVDASKRTNYYEGSQILELGKERKS